MIIKWINRIVTMGWLVLAFYCFTGGDITNGCLLVILYYLHGIYDLIYMGAEVNIYQKINIQDLLNYRKMVDEIEAVLSVTDDNVWVVDFIDDMQNWTGDYTHKQKRKIRELHNKLCEIIETHKNLVKEPHCE